MEISIIIPVYNEGRSISPLYEELNPILEKLNKDYEIIFVDNGSRDNTFEEIKKIHQKNTRVKCVRVRKNLGLTAGISAGIKFATGRYIITMDGDLQYDPKDIPKLIEKIEKGYDLVNGWRYLRRDNLLTKKIPSRISNFLNSFGGVKLHDQGCSLRIMREETLRDLKLYGEFHRYIPTLIYLNGYDKITEIKVNHRNRQFGKTHFNYKSIIKGMLDFLEIKFWTGYSSRPLHVFGTFGLIQYIISVILILFEVLRPELIMINGFDSLEFALLLLVTGTLFVLNGFIANILVKTYYGKSGEDYYIISEILR